MNINVVEARACAESRQSQCKQMRKAVAQAFFFFFCEGRNRLSGWRTPGVAGRIVAIHQSRLGTRQLLLPSARRSAAAEELAAAHQVGRSS